MDAMNHKFDDLHIDGGMGPTRIPGPGSAAEHDARFELETEMRNRTLWGPTNGDPLQHGHVMATTMENYVKYAPGSERTAITEQHTDQQNFQEDLLQEFQVSRPE